MPDPLPFPPLDPDRNQIVLCVGRKGSGKSVAGRELFRAWPNVDRLVIDPTGDADPGADLDPVTLRTLPPVGQGLPARKNGLPGVWRFIADPRKPTYHDDLDNAVGLALYPKHRRTLLWVDEAGEVFPAGRTGPHGRTLLHQSRHWQASAVLCCPRPMHIDPLCLAQADRVLIWDVPQPADRDRLAGAIGWPARRLATELDLMRTAPAHSFLMYVAAEHTLYRCPPMPLSPPQFSHAT
jgi:hypothetical protein